MSGTDAAEASSLGTQLRHLVRSFLGLTKSGSDPVPVEEIMRALLRPRFWFHLTITLAFFALALRVFQGITPDFLYYVMLGTLLIGGLLFLRLEWHLLTRKPRS
jgi:hypothetical protein